MFGQSVWSIQIKVVPLHSIFLVYLDNLFTIVKLISAEMARKF